jgi:TolB protein
MARAWLAGSLGVVALLGPASLGAQDTVPPAEGVRVGITYTPGLRPGMLVLGGARRELLDSVRAIVQRDLDYSDRFEMITLPGGDSLVVGPGDAGPGSGGRPFINYPLYGALGADYAVDVADRADSGLEVVVYDVKGRGVRRAVRLQVADLKEPDFRLKVHQASDELVRAAAGAPGIAATRLLFLQDDGRVYRIDADGADAVPVTPAGVKAFSPVWTPDGQRLVYAELPSGRLLLRDVQSGRQEVIPPTTELLNFAPAVSPDGRLLVFTRSAEDGTHLYAYNLAEHCCLQRLTAGRFSDNLSPTFSPDGRRIAFASTRAGSPQIYVMSADGTEPELFAPFDYGVTGSSYAPEWSPDGLHLAFHREVAGTYQVFVMDVASRTVRQLTSAGRNEDPTWAPDGRHLAFVSNRTGTRQIWVMDMDTGRVRQLTRQGGTRLPSWSPRLSPTVNH